VTIAAAILAGGKGERLGGVNKALIAIGGRRMIDHVLDACAGCEPVLLCGGENAFAADLPVAPANIIADLASDYAGPLAGVAAAVAELEHRGAPALLLTSAVDTPLMPADFAGRANAMIGDADAVVGSYGGQDYPTQALWRFAALHGLPDGVRTGTAPHSLKRLMAAKKCVRLNYSALPQNPFANANTPEELAALSARMRP
jgi:molybdopterin-guanine dinucleotide biosynthesis protein A